MASLLPGFAYDVFISYRQKHNKGDHWVTEFVNALKTELESTSKEDLSIYFDEYPHDGLHERARWVVSSVVSLPQPRPGQDTFRRGSLSAH